MGMVQRNAAAEFSAATTQSILVHACMRAGLDPRGARLLRLGEHALYALAIEPIVVRIARSMRALDDAKKETRVARWLHGVGFPAARLADIECSRDPIVVDEHPVTFWQEIKPGRGSPTSADLGHLLKRLHEFDVPAWLELPAFDPFRKIEHRLQNAPPVVDDEEVRFLVELFDRLKVEFASLHYRFPFTASHGDAHPGNLLRDSGGEVVMMDFEAFSFGPREWDLSLTAAYRYGFDWSTPSEYDAFVNAYGYDVSTWSGFGTLRSIRELGMTAWIMQLVGTDPEIEPEFSQRVSDLITGELPRQWRPF